MTDATTLRTDAVHAVEEDGDLLPEEKETAIHFCKRDDRVQVVSYEAGIGRRLLAHPEAERVTVSVLSGGKRSRVPLQDWDGEQITGVEATLPVGALGIKSEARKTTQHAQIISKRVLDALRASAEGGERQ